MAKEIFTSYFLLMSEKQNFAKDVNGFINTLSIADSFEFIKNMTFHHTNIKVFIELDDSFRSGDNISLLEELITVCIAKTSKKCVVEIMFSYDLLDSELFFNFILLNKDSENIKFIMHYFIDENINYDLYDKINKLIESAKSINNIKLVSTIKKLESDFIEKSYASLKLNIEILSFFCSVKYRYIFNYTEYNKTEILSIFNDIKNSDLFENVHTKLKANETFTNVFIIENGQLVPFSSSHLSDFKEAQLVLYNR